jgi:peroxiredoxin
MRLVIAFALCAGALLAAGEFSGRRAPGFALYDSQFKFHDTQDYRGKILLIDFMQTTCPHCANLTGILEKVKAKYPGKVEVISVVNPPDTTATMARYAAAHQVTGPLVFDCGQAAASYLAIKGNTSITVPHLFLVDPQGIIRNDWAYDLLTRDIFEGQGLFSEVERMLTEGTSKKK